MGHLPQSAASGAIEKQCSGHQTCSLRMPLAKALQQPLINLYDQIIVPSLIRHILHNDMLTATDAWQGLYCMAYGLKDICNLKQDMFVRDLLGQSSLQAKIPAALQIGAQHQCS